MKRMAEDGGNLDEYNNLETELFGCDTSSIDSVHILDEEDSYSIESVHSTDSIVILDDTESDGNSEESFGKLDREELEDSVHQLNLEVRRLKTENDDLKNELSCTIPIYDQDSSSSLPLVQVRFKNNSLAQQYKKEVKKFLHNLLTKEIKGRSVKQDNESLQLQIYQDFCIDNVQSLKENDVEEWQVPLYNQEYKDALQAEKAQKSKKMSIMKCVQQTILMRCFNCLGNHCLSDCPEQVNKARVAKNRKEYFKSVNHSSLQTSRYHVSEDFLKKFKPGVLSEKLRKALDLDEDQIPRYIYQMRVLGYPPGWSKEAEIHNSELAMYDCEGKVKLYEENEDEDKLEYDPELIIDYPGFNVPLPVGCVDEHKRYGMPAIQFHQLRCVKEMNVKTPESVPYQKRKFPGIADQYAKNVKIEDTQEDMDIEFIEQEGRIIESDDEEAQLCKFIPPLPRENPPTPSPPPLPDDIPPVIELDQVLKPPVPNCPSPLPTYEEVEVDNKSHNQPAISFLSLPKNSIGSLLKQRKELAAKKRTLSPTVKKKKSKKKLVSSLITMKRNRKKSSSKELGTKNEIMLNKNTSPSVKEKQLTTDCISSFIVTPKNEASLGSLLKQKRESSIQSAKRNETMLNKDAAQTVEANSLSSVVILRKEETISDQKQLKNKPVDSPKHLKIVDVDSDLLQIPLTELEAAKRRLIDELENVSEIPGKEVVNKLETVPKLSVNSECCDKPIVNNMEVPQIILIGDCVCKNLCFEKFCEDGNLRINVFSRDEWKLQSAVEHLKTEGVSLTGKEVMFVHLGINDFLSRGNSSIGEVSSNAKNSIQEIKKQVSSLVISAILPSSFFSSVNNHKIQCLNILIRELCKTERVGFLNLRKAFVQNGKLNSDFFQTENFHPSESGIKILEEVLLQIFESVITKIRKQNTCTENKMPNYNVSIEWFDSTYS